MTSNFFDVVKGITSSALSQKYENRINKIEELIIKEAESGNSYCDIEVAIPKERQYIRSYFVQEKFNVGELVDQDDDNILRISWDHN